MVQQLWLRCEKKPFERRSALTPTTSKKLIDVGFEIIVERDHQRIFDDSEFEAVGCKLVANNAWPSAPTDIPIIGPKELPVSDDPLPHTHIQFAHCYKKQAGWASVLDRFHRGGGTLHDPEFCNENGRDLGHYAGKELNEFRKFIGLRPYKSFREWNPDPITYLYGHIDNLELHVGLQAEETKPPIPGAGLCPGYTISRAILSDAGYQHCIVNAPPLPDLIVIGNHKVDIREQGGLMSRELFTKLAPRVVAAVFSLRNIRFPGMQMECAGELPASKTIQVN